MGSIKESSDPQEPSPGVLQQRGLRVALLEIDASFWSIRRQMDELIGSSLASSVLKQAGVGGGTSFAESVGVAKNVQEQAHNFDICLKTFQSAGFGKFDIQSLDLASGKAEIHVHEAFEAWAMLQHGQQNGIPACAYTSGVLSGLFNTITSRRNVVCVEQHCQSLGHPHCEFKLYPVANAEEQDATITPNLKLGQQINLLDLLFERMPMGIAILDKEFHVQRYNPTWGDFAKRYAPSSGTPLRPGVGYFEHLPGSESSVLPLFERALGGETIRANNIRLESGGFVTYWDIVLAPLMESGDTVGILNIAVDVTEQVNLQHNLEDRVNERTRELKMLLDVSAAANNSLNLGETLERTLDLVVELVGASCSGVLLLDELTGELVSHTFRPAQEFSPDDIPNLISECQSVIASGSPENAEVKTPRALLPLQIREMKLGVLVIVGSQDSSFSKAQMALFQSIADQLSVTIENARLLKKSELAAVAAERNRLARDLHDAVTQTLFSASMIADVLPRIWERNPEEGRHRLEELRQLTRGALSEMRTLLVELRPGALDDTDLGDLTEHQVNAFIARTRLRVDYSHNCVQNPPLDVKEVYYRVTQEAFNNIAKHSDATQIIVRLNCEPGHVKLLIEDNGVGFATPSPNHEGLGMRIMKERAQSIGAQFTIQSQPYGGVQLIMIWDAPYQESKNE